jgi:hypothetical protein
MGPSIGVLLRHSLTEEQLIDLEHWLETITAPPGRRRRTRPQVAGQRGAWGPFWIRDGRLIDLPSVDCNQSCAFWLTLEQPLTEPDGSSEAERDMLLEEHLQLSEYLGYLPEQELWIAAGCHRSPDWRILYQLALRLSERYAGLIRLDRPLFPPLKSHQRREEVTVEEIIAYVNGLKLPGRVFHVYGNALTGFGNVTLWHLVDPTWLRTWLHQS